jgi:N6-L-threonylcarbamoyladenine synthase
VAKLLGLGYPGGPIIDKLAKTGNDRAFALPMARMTHADRNQPAPTAPSGLLPPSVERRVDFSFSGLKTAVARVVAQARATDPRLSTLDPGVVSDISASFQRVVVQALLDRSFEAAAWLGARSLGIAGGVSANSALRAEAEARGAKAGLPVFVPPLSLSTDNAAMIGAAAMRKLRTGVTADWDLNAQASLAL